MLVHIKEKKYWGEIFCKVNNSGDFTWIGMNISRTVWTILYKIDTHMSNVLLNQWLKFWQIRWYWEIDIYKRLKIKSKISEKTHAVSPTDKHLKKFDLRMYKKKKKKTDSFIQYKKCIKTKFIHDICNF